MVLTADLLFGISSTSPNLNQLYAGVYCSVVYVAPHSLISLLHVKNREF